MPQLRLFAPDDDGHYILASSAAEPSLVIDRKAQGTCRIAETAEVKQLNRAGKQACKVNQTRRRRRLAQFPDERGIWSSPKPRRGRSPPAPSSTPPPDRQGRVAASAARKWRSGSRRLHSHRRRQKRSSAFGAGISALSDLAKQAKATATEEESSSSDQGEEQKAEESLQEKGIKQRQYLKETLEAGDMCVCDLRAVGIPTRYSGARGDPREAIERTGLLPPPSLDDSDGTSSGTLSPSPR